MPQKIVYVFAKCTVVSCQKKMKTENYLLPLQYKKVCYKN